MKPFKIKLSFSYEAEYPTTIAYRGQHDESLIINDEKLKEKLVEILDGVMNGMGHCLDTKAEVPVATWRQEYDHIPEQAVALARPTLHVPSTFHSADNIPFKLEYQLPPRTTALNIPLDTPVPTFETQEEPKQITEDDDCPF